MPEYGVRYRTPEPGGKMVKFTADNDVDFSGDFTVTFTASGTTAVTLPTSGTLFANGGSLRAATATPASAAAAGTAGTIAWDASYIYVCTATNTWKRVAIATW